MRFVAQPLGLGNGEIGSCRSDPESNRARSGQAAELTMSVCGRLNFFGAGPSPEHIGGGRSSATAVELASYHRDEIRSAVTRLSQTRLELASLVSD